MEMIMSTKCGLMTSVALMTLGRKSIRVQAYWWNKEVQTGGTALLSLKQDLSGADMDCILHYLKGLVKWRSPVKDTQEQGKRKTSDSVTKYSPGDFKSSLKWKGKNNLRQQLTLCSDVYLTVFCKTCTSYKIHTTSSTTSWDRPGPS